MYSFPYYSLDLAISHTVSPSTSSSLRRSDLSLRLGPLVLQLRVEEIATAGGRNVKAFGTLVSFANLLFTARKVEKVVSLA